MRLKHYQEKVITALQIYLSALDEFRGKYEKALEFDADMAMDYNFPKRAFKKAVGGGIYHTKQNGLGEPLPDVYLKVPTGGGKTFLACHSIDLIQKTYLKKQTGLVLWIMPSEPIYKQTIKRLKDRQDPYRQILDISSGGRTLIKEKTELFTRLDVEENLVILMLMLPSAWRENKETLRLFRDSGGFTDFFPREDDVEAHRQLKQKIKNLDCFTSENEIFNTQIKTSLGNTLKLLKPLVIVDEGAGGPTVVAERETTYRAAFKEFEGTIYLPKFVIQEKESWRDIIFEADILSGIDWEKMDVKEIAEKTLSDKQNKEQELTLGLSKEEKDLLQETGRLETKGTLEIDEAFLARQLGDVIPNPWIAYELGHKALELLAKKYDKEIIAANFVFVIEELKKILEKEKNKMAEVVFRKLIDTKKLCFFLIQEKGHHLLPSRIKVKSNKQLVRDDNSPIANSLFDYVPEEDLNETEKAVAIYLDQQEQLLWWYRNRVRKDFHIQGWQKHKIYPDFITAKKNKAKEDDYDKVYVIETKGTHLKNEDTSYKQNVFKLCNELGAKKAWKELFEEFPDKDFEFQVVFSDEWKNEINKIVAV